MNIFGLKIMTTKRYEKILSRVSECGDIYRKYSDDGYSTQGLSANVPLNELSRICLVENLMLEDIKDYLKP